MQQDPSIPWSPLPPVAAPPSLPPPLCPVALAPLVTAKFTAWLMEDNYPHRALCREDTEARVHVVLDLLREALRTCNKNSIGSTSINTHPQPLEGHQVLQLWEDNKTLLEPLVDRDSTSLHCWRSFLSFLKQHPNDYKYPPANTTKSSSSSSSTASTASSKRHHADVELGPAGSARSRASKNKKHIVSSNIITRTMVPPPPLPLLPPSCLKSGSSTSAAHLHQATATPATTQSKRVRFHVGSDEDGMFHATKDDKKDKHASALQSAPVQREIYPPPPPPSTCLNTAGGPLSLPSPLPSLYAPPFSASSSSSSTTYTKASKKEGKSNDHEQQMKKGKKKASALPSSLLSSLLQQAHMRSQEQQMQQQMQQQMPHTYQGFYQQQGYVPVCYLPGKGVIYGKPSMSSGSASAAPPPLPTSRTDLLKVPSALAPPAPSGAGEILSELPAAAPLPSSRRYSSSKSIDVLVKMRAQSKRHCQQEGAAAAAHEPLSVVERGRRKKKGHGNKDGRKYRHDGDGGGGEEMDAVVHTLLSLASAGPQHSDQEQAHGSKGQESGDRIIQEEEDQRHHHHEGPPRQERVMIHV